MKIKGLLFLGLLFLTGLINAQTDFRPGYVISLDGDTLIGEIDYRDDIRMSKICLFKSKDSDNEIKFTPNNIIAFRFNEGKYFVSKEVNGGKIFLEFLIKAKVSVFYVRDNKGDHYFLEKEGLGLTEIPYVEGTIVIDKKVYFNKPTKYIGVLNYYMHDAPEFQSKIYSMGEPSHKNLIKLAEDYHNKVCKDNKCVIYEKKLPAFKLSIEPSVRLGKYPSKYSVYGNTFEYGSNLYLWMPQASEKLYFKTGLFFVNSDRGNFLKLPLQFQYLYPSKVFRPKVNIGVDVFLGDNSSNAINGYLPQVGIGFIYKIYKKIYFSANLNLEYPPFLTNISNDYGYIRKFVIISHSYNLGFYIDL